MAIRKREGRAKPWQCYWNNPITGKRESESFETKEEALKQDSLIKHRLKFERESFRPEEAAEEKSEITLEQAYVAYLREKQFSRKSLQWQLECMRLPLSMLGATPLSKIQLEDLQGVMAAMTKTGIKQVTIRGRMSVLRTVLRWSAEQGLCEMPRFPKLPGANYEKFIPPTPEEVQKIIDVSPPHIQRAVILGVQTGCRIGQSELLGLKWQDVDLVRGVIRIHGAKKNANAPWREVPLGEGLIALLAEWAIEDKEKELEYLITYQGHPIKTFQCAWQRILKRAGITRRIRPYDLRHAFATELIAAGADIGTVAKLMGHSTPTMVLSHYQYVMDKQKRAAVEKLPELPHVPNPCAQKYRQPAEKS